ncbi:MAG: hypothetical protein ACREIB_07160, partial [Pseudomonadota bacterium]
LVDLIINTPSRKDLIVRCRALDRVLQWSFFAVPNFYLAATRVAYWDKFSMPAKRPDPAFGYGGSGWWIDPQKSQTIEASKTTDAAQPAEAQSTAPVPAARQPAAQSSEATPAAPAEPADRGRSPLIYGVAAIVVVVVAYALSRRRKS